MLNLKGFPTYSTFNHLLGFNIFSTKPEYSFFFQLFLNDRNVIEGLFILCLSNFSCLSAFSDYFKAETWQTSSGRNERQICV